MAKTYTTQKHKQKGNSVLNDDAKRFNSRIQDERDGTYQEEKKQQGTRAEVVTKIDRKSKTSEMAKISEQSIDLVKVLDQELGKAVAPQLKGRSERKEKASEKARSFNIGDSVLVFPNKEKGLVFQPVNEEGKIGVQIKGAKKWIVAKRLKLLVAARPHCYRCSHPSQYV